MFANYELHYIRSGQSSLYLAYKQTHVLHSIGGHQPATRTNNSRQVDISVYRRFTADYFRCGT